jgi:hypothetical protein
VYSRTVCDESDYRGIIIIIIIIIIISVSLPRYKTKKGFNTDE